MASQDAELQLKVSLDLAFFRQEMQKVSNIASSEFTGRLAVKFNRQILDTELNNLQRSLARRSYRIELKSNFKTQAEFAERIAAVVPALERAAAAFKQLGKGAGGGSAMAEKSIKDQISLQARLQRELARKGGKGGGYSAAAIGRMYDEASRQGLTGISKNATNRTERSKELSVAFASAGKNAVNSFIDAFQEDINKGAAAGEELGRATYEGLKKQMQIASPSKRMKKLGQESSEGFVIGLNEGLDDVEKYAQKIKSILDGVARSVATTGKSIANIQGKRLGLGNLPLMSRSLEGKGGRSAAAIGGVSSSSVLRALYPEVNRTITSLSILRSQVEQNTRKLSGFGLIIGLAAFAGVPLAKSIVKLTGSANNFAELLDSIGVKLQSAFDKAASNILNASSSRLLSGGSLAGLLPAAYRGIGPAAGPAGLLSGRGGPAGLLPPAYRGIKPAASPAGSLRGGASPAGLLPPAYRGLPFGFDFKALPPSKGGKLALSNNAMASRVNPLLDKNFINSFIKSTNDAIKTVRARLRTAGVEAFKLEREVLPTRPPGRETRLLPAGVGRTPSSYATGAIGGETQAQIFARREREARMRSDLRSVAITGTAMVPYAPGGAIVPTGGAGAPPSPPRPPSGGTGGGMGAFGRALGNVQLPGAGLVREIGSEFAMAAKQVLLFGTAYKALAFLTSFPAQVGEAVASLQSFRNTLREITPSAEEFSASNKFILSLVDQYNIPLQSARDGFAKLYASMQPAGFSGKEIRGLFEGISMGAATFGMSADKVDRVMYAFAQMASKGQVMSEELKGQLGDVLPGALALFARAAKMSMTDFGKAMEDGAFKGNAMRQLLINVGATMKEEFGKGAVGAALTYQGVLNRLQTTTVLFYETFEPLAVAFANTFVLPLTNGIRIVTDAFRQLTTGQAALTQGGGELAAKMQTLVPTLSGIGENIKMAANAAVNLAKAFAPVVQLFLQLISTPIVGVLAQVYTSVILLNGAFTLLGGRILLNLIGNLIQTVVQMTALNVASVTTTSSLTNTRISLGLLASGFATTGAAAVSFAAVLKTAMMTTVVGAIATAVAFGVSEFMRLRGVMDSVAGRYKSIGDQARLMGESGNVSGVQRLTKNLQDQANSYEEIAAGLNRAKKGGGYVKIDKATQDLLKRTGLGGYDSAGTGVLTNEDANNIKAAINSNRQETRKTRQILIEQEAKAATEAAKIDATLKKQAIVPEPGKPGKEKSLESYYSLQDQLAKAQTQDEIDRIQSEFDYKTKLANSYYDLQEARANSFQKITIAFQKELFAIEQRRQQASISAQADVLKAQGSVAGGAGPTAGGAVPMTGGSATGAYLQGNIGPTSTGPHFDVKKMGRGYFPRDYLDQYVQVNGRPLSSGTTVRGGTFAGHQKRGSHGWDYAFGEGRHAATLKGGAKWMEGRPTEHGEARKFQLPTGEMFQLLHGKSEGIGAGAPRQVPGSEKRDLLADQQAAIALRNQSASSLQAEAIAAEESAIAIANYVAAIAPVAEQQLQNSILEKRISLMKSGLSGNLLDTEIQIFEQQEKQKIATAALTRNIEENNQKVKDKKMSEQDAIRLNKRLLDTINDLNIAIPLSTKLTKENAMAQADSAFIGRVNTLKEEIRLLLIVSDAERKLAELKKDFNGDEAQAQAIFNLEDIKKNIEETRALVGNFVSSTTGDYKGFLKAVISGEDATDALQKFQEGLKDKVLTIFFDFAMGPVDKFLKEGLEGLLLPQQDKGPVEAQLAHVKSIDAKVSAIANQTSQAGAAAATAAPTMGGQATLTSLSSSAMAFGGAGGEAISSALASTFESAQASIGLSMESLASSFEYGKDKLLEGVPPFEQALTVDLPGQVEKSTEALKAKGSTFSESLGKLTQGVGIAVGSIMGIAAGISQVKKGGTGNTLMGIGSVLASVGGAIGGFSKLSKAANGAVWTGGFQAFANGGTVKGPTLGLVGEGKYNEAIVPLPDGRSIPVQMRGGPGGGSSRDLLAAQSQSRSSPSVLSMSFQSTTINGVEYVDRAQLEMAMAETRRVASRDGAARGANLAIDRLANSPSSRRRAGIR